MGVGAAGLYMYDVVLKMFTFAPDELLFFLTAHIRDSGKFIQTRRTGLDRPSVRTIADLGRLI